MTINEEVRLINNEAKYLMFLLDSDVKHLDILEVRKSVMLMCLRAEKLLRKVEYDEVPKDE